jgi:hypothetical protein
MNSPVFCTKCEPFDERHGNCYACRNTSVKAIPERKRHTLSKRRREKLFRNKRSQWEKYKVRCSKCKRRVSFDFVDSRGDFATMEEVHQYADYQRESRMRRKKSVVEFEV